MRQIKSYQSDFEAVQKARCSAFFNHLNCLNVLNDWNNAAKRITGREA
jgi:hypothetical protein